MVTRYKMQMGRDPWRVVKTEAEDGQWVRYEDYAALEQEVQDQAKVIRAVVEGVEDGSIVWNKPKEKETLQALGHADCEIDIYSSRVCELGTKSCIKDHSKDTNTLEDGQILEEDKEILQALGNDKPYCVECHDEVKPHDPGVCGNCYAMKYRKEG